MDNKDIEMQNQPSSDKNPTVEPAVVVEERPPTPPKRDYQTQQQEKVMVSEPEASKRKRFRSFQRPEFIYRPESSGSCMTCLKNLLIIFNLLIWLFGAALTGIGIWVKVDQEFWDIQTGLDMTQFSNAGYILIAAGVAIMLVGFVGCYGAMALKLWMLVLYSVFIVIIIFMEIAVMAVVWSASTNKEMQEAMKGRGRKAIQEMAEVDGQRYLIDLLQTKLSCCGIDGVDDYGEGTIPPSCIDPNTGSPSKQGCLDEIIKYFKSKASILGGVAIAVFVLQLAALVITLCIACGLKQADKIY